MAADLDRSGLTLADAKKRRWDIEYLSDRVGMTIRYFDARDRAQFMQSPATRRPFYRFRFLGDLPPRRAPDEKPLRYWQPKGSGVCAYFDPTIEWGPILDNPAAPVIITEGEKKAAKACKEGFPTIALGGVDSFRSKKLGLEFLPELDGIAWTDRVVHIVFDSDAKTKRDVKRAVRTLSAKLKQRGAIVQQVQLPDVPGCGKTGLDDFLVHKGAKALGALLVAPSADGPGGTFDEPAPEFGDAALARRFADAHAGDLRYVALWGQWLRYDGKRWAREETKLALNLAREVCVAASTICENENLARAITSGKTISAVERLAQADRRLAATVDQWDVDPWLLNTPGGTIDLRTGKERPHDRNDYITKMTSVAPSGGCPRWLAFVREIMSGDAELVGFLRRMAGYALTGITREHALFFGHGSGGNGKGVFVRALSGVLGDYAMTAPMETFIAASNGQHPTDLAMLRGARLVVAQETEEGRRWAEAKIKSMTGGDPITARFMRQDFFTFVPQFKLVIMGNHKPGLRSVDEAIRRRMNLIPFAVTFQKSDQDELLDEKLRAEWPGILRWMVDGCVEWRRDGLDAPATVRSATDDYLESEDVMGLWLAERYEVRPGSGFKMHSATLFADWKFWAEAAKEYVGSQKTFSQKLQDRGLALKKKVVADVDGRKVEGRGFEGIRLKPAEVRPSAPAVHNATGAKSYGAGRVVPFGERGRK